MKTPRQYLSLSEAADRLQVRPRTLSRWIAQGRFPAYRTPGGRYRIAAADLHLALEPGCRVRRWVRPEQGQRPERQGDDARGTGGAA